MSLRNDQLEANKLQKRLRRNVGKAVADYRMIEEGDRIMVCLSGGKDSYAMLDILMNLQKNAPIKFDLVAVNLDQKQPGFPEHVLPAYLDKLDIEYHILEKDTYSIVTSKIPEGKTYCSLCSRLRRGTLYGFAEQIGATKVALGHHRDDIVETLFLNMFYQGKLKAMPPKLLSDDKIPCNLCGSQAGLQRNAVKDMLKQWERQFPGRVDAIFGAIKNVAPSQLADTELFDFVGLTRGRLDIEADGHIEVESLIQAINV
jgi:tRNA 2-thiocytidine biosynthesis protein TtcA